MKSESGFSFAIASQPFQFKAFTELLRSLFGQLPCQILDPLCLWQCFEVYVLLNLLCKDGMSKLNERVTSHVKTEI